MDFAGPASPIVKLQAKFFGGLSFEEMNSGYEQSPDNSSYRLGSPSPDSSPCFDAADELEKGWCDVPFNLRHPPPASDKLKRYTILFTGSEYQLMTESLELILVARRRPGSRLIVDFTSPCEGEGEGGSSPSRRSPIFTLTFNKASDECLLEQPRCDCCAHRPHHLTCEFMGRSQQLARIRHSRRNVAKCSVHHIDVFVPPLISEELSAVWCPARIGKDLGSSTPLGLTPTNSPMRNGGRSFFPDLTPQEGSKPLQLRSKLPVWNTELEALILNFEGRSMLKSCPRNFIVIGESSNDDRPVFQHAKIADNTWCLDFKNPLSLVQAFALAMSSLDWD
eukprot:TRINITY_DN67530_c0_g1_i1.p1 TRINITY_DN67530_c0_g1~~TRINITY_DN67530_c0_g1_i1.p1  ORF type:complete len:356 (-),score=31.35 TRINITY_DN67530_c0_g1_i1:14-1021(-)